MPSIAAHLACAKIIAERYDIISDDFLLGNILPDITINPDSHHKINSTNYLVPDITYFLEHLDLSTDLAKGYMAHLLLDKYFLEEFVPQHVKDYQNAFISKKIYEDYSRISNSILNYFRIDRLRCKRVIDNTQIPLDSKLVAANLAYLDNKIDAKTQILDYNSFIEFLKRISLVIGSEVLDGKYSCVPVRFRQCDK